MDWAWIKGDGAALDVADEAWEDDCDTGLATEEVLALHAPGAGCFPECAAPALAFPAFVVAAAAAVVVVVVDDAAAAVVSGNGAVDGCVVAV